MKKILLVAMGVIIVMIMPAQGIYQLWGTTSAGGPDNAGVVFKTDDSGDNYEVRHIFTVGNSGAKPSGHPIEYNGKFYGMTLAGGANNLGVIYEWDPVTNIYSKKKDFNSIDGNSPYGSLTLYGNKFYGMTNKGGARNLGVIFEWDPATNVYTKKIDFDPVITIGNSPFGSLTFSGTKFYGMTSNRIFEWDPATNVYIDKSNINGGSSPAEALVSYNGKFYGIASRGGTNNVGMIFEWDAVTNVFTKKFDFAGSLGTGGFPSGQIVLREGKFYGTTGGVIGGITPHNGTIYEWDPATGIFTTKIDFGGASGNIGSLPTGSLALINDKFYGATSASGPTGPGVIYEWDPVTNIYTSKSSFNGTNGQDPNGSLIFSGGKFYGTTVYGGVNDAGVIFAWDPATNVYAKKIDFNAGSPEGNTPFSSLAQRSGKLYGMTSLGGSDGKGVIFEIDPITNSYTKKIDLSVANGSSPNGNGLKLCPCSGKFYGMTTEGGANNLGVIFEWDPATNIYTKKIDLNSTNGYGPHGNLTHLGDKFYGMTSNGGAHGAGVIFEWDPATNVYTKRFDFNGLNPDGSTPYGSLTTFGAKLYGMTRFGGTDKSNGFGVIFEWDPATNVYTRKVDLSVYVPGPISGDGPLGSLTLYNNKFYGFNLSGPLFEWDPITNIINKYGYLEGAQGSLTLSNGKLYGMSSQAIIEWDPAASTLTTKKIFNGSDGWFPSIGNDLSRVQVPVAKGLRNNCVNFASVTIDNSNNNKWVAITDNNGDAVAEIKANGNNLGIVNSSMYINDAPVREDGIKRLYLDRNLTITPQSQPAAPVDIRLYFKGSEYQALKNANNSSGEPSGITAISDVGIFKMENNSCSSSIELIANPVASSVEEWQKDFVVSASISSFSSFYFANKNFDVLPLTLLEFNGRLANGNAMLNWKTANEQHVAGFEVERSVDGVRYAVVGTITATNTAGIHEYTFTDPGILSLNKKIVYYRLKQKDNNGRYSSSRIVALGIDSRNIVLFYPNPVKDKANVTITLDQAQQFQARVIDASGKALIQQQWKLSAGSTSLSVDVSRLATGVYYLELKGATVNERRQFSKQ